MTNTPPTPTLLILRRQAAALGAAWLLTGAPFAPALPLEEKTE